LIRLDTFRSRELACYLNLECKNEKNQAVDKLYHQSIMGVIIFSDLDRNIYILRVEEADIKCTKIHKHSKVITSIQMDPSGNIVLMTEDKTVTVLRIDWVKETMTGSELLKDQADYFYENSYEVRFVNANQSDEYSKKGSHKH